MTEWYVVRSVRLLDGRARYSNYRRFQVATDWEVVDTEKERPPAGDAPRP